MKTTLLIMAAGIGSRFGTGIKQLEPVDDENHIIMSINGVRPHKERINLLKLPTLKSGFAP